MKSHRIRFWTCFVAAMVLCVGCTHAQIERNLRHTSGEGRLSRADSLFLMNEIDSATLALDSDLAVDPGNPYLFYNRGLAARLRLEGNGLRYFTRAYELGMQSEHLCNMLGMALTERGRFTEGEAYYREAIDINRNFYEASVALGHNLRLQGRGEEAVEAIEGAFGQDRNYVYAYTELAEACLSVADTNRALEVLTTGYERFPFEPVSIALLRLQTELHNTDAAIQVAEEYIVRYPFGLNMPEVLALFAELDPNRELPTEFCYSNTAYPDSVEPVDPATVLPLGRRLTYEVKYGFIRLGTLQIDMQHGTFKGHPCFRAQYITTSNPTLPFVSIVDTFMAVIDREMTHTVHFQAMYHERNYNAYTVYDTDYSTGIFMDRTVYGDGTWYYIEHPLPPNTFDASSMIWFAQQLVIAGVSGIATNEISSSFEKTIINVNGPDDQVRAAGERWDTIHVDGIMRYSGVAGLTGRYQGWFMEDPPYWPVIAKFQIFLGSITLRYAGEEPIPVDLSEGWIE